MDFAGSLAITPPGPQQFDRLAGLPDQERRPYNIIVEGRGRLLQRWARQRLKSADSEDPGGDSAIGQRYLAGEALLRRLKIGETPSQLGEAGKPSLVVLPSATARTLTVVFSGNNPEFALPAHLLTAQDTHLILIHDRRRCFALAGVPGLGSDYATSLAALGRIVEALQPDHVAMLGISAGGAGAIKFACDLHAQTLLALSVPTTLDLADDPGAELSRYPQLAKLYRHDRSLGIDLAAYFDAQAIRPDTILVYGTDHPRDSWLAMRMSGMRGTTLLGVPGFTGHTTYRFLSLQGTLGSYLDKMYPPAPAAAQLRADGLIAA